MRPLPTPLGRSILSELVSCGSSTAVEELRRRGVRRVRVVKREQLERLIERSLDRALECHLLSLSDDERALILTHALTDLERRRRAERGVASWVGEFNDESDAIGREILEAAQAGQPSLGRGVDLTALASVIGAIGLTSVGETQRIALAVAGFLRSEEDRLREEAAREQSERVELLERRLSRLSEVLRNTERELEEALQHTRTEEGIASIHRSIQGLRETQADFARKRALLSEVFEKNVKLRAAAETDSASPSAPAARPRTAVPALLN